MISSNIPLVDNKIVMAIIIIIAINNITPTDKRAMLVDVRWLGTTYTKQVTHLAHDVTDLLFPPV